MAPMTQRRFASVDDDETFDAELFDPKYYPKRVYRDGKGPRVALMLTDAAPPPRRPLHDARYYYPPRTYVGDSVELRDAERKAEAARDAWIRGLQDAWRTPSVPPTTGLPPNPDGDDDAGLSASPRDRYIRRMQGAYRTPYGRALPDDDAGAGAIEAMRRRVTSEDRPGRRAPPGVTMGAHDPGAFPSRDAALADRDVAYGEYLDYLQNAWKRPCGVVAGGKR